MGSMVLRKGGDGRWRSAMGGDGRRWSRSEEGGDRRDDKVGCV